MKEHKTKGRKTQKKWRHVSYVKNEITQARKKLEADKARKQTKASKVWNK